MNLDTTMRICCNTHNTGKILDNENKPILLKDVHSLEEYFNTDHYKKIRREMLSGSRPDLCKNCFEIEDNGGHSLRQVFLSRFYQETHFKSQLENTSEDGSIQPHVTYLDFALGNKCNLKCVMCNPTATTILKHDFDQMGWSYDKASVEKSEVRWSEEDIIMRSVLLCLPTVKEMLFTGGEPLLSNLHIRILRKIVEMGKDSEITLRYHSNMMYISDDLLKTWEGFKAVELHASIEGYGDLNDYIRYGSKFKTIESNIKRTADLANIHIEVHTCFQVPTVFGLPRLYEWLHDLHPRVPPLPYHIWVNYPDWFEISIMPENLKAFARQTLESSLAELVKKIPQTRMAQFQGKVHQVRSLLNRMDAQPSNPNQWHEFKRRISDLQNLRKNDLSSLQPELFK